MSRPIVERLLPFAPPHHTAPSTSSGTPRTEFAWIQAIPGDQCTALLEALFLEDLDQDPSAVAQILVELIHRAHNEAITFSEQARLEVTKAYPRLEPYPPVQALLLRLLIATGERESLLLFTNLLVQHVLEPRLLIEVFGDLLKLDGSQREPLFPGILRGLAEPGLASFVLDYANFIHRQGTFEAHPATPHAGELRSLLSRLSDRLGTLQDAQPDSREAATELGRQVTESVALAVALCDALACIGDTEAVASLNKALGVEHRRVRVEAAAALTKLGAQDAKELLLRLASDPVERLRVLAYAEELEILDEVDEEFSNISARAEAEMVTHLAQPTQIGIAPQHIELIDQRELAWPGFEEPRNCFLFQYVYSLPQGEFTNIGIAGPTVMTLNADLTHLSPDDVYGLFAGWHVDHPEIFATEPSRTVGDQQVHMQRLLTVLTDVDDYGDVSPALMGSLFERTVLVARATRHGEPGWALVSDDAINWVPEGNPRSPLGPGEAFYLFVGRALLASFN